MVRKITYKPYQHLKHLQMSDYRQKNEVVPIKLQATKIYMKPILMERFKFISSRHTCLYLGLSLRNEYRVIFSYLRRKSVNITVRKYLQKARKFEVLFTVSSRIILINRVRNLPAKYEIGLYLLWTKRMVNRDEYKTMAMIKILIKTMSHGNLPGSLVILKS